MSKTSEVQLKLKKPHITRLRSDHKFALKSAISEDVEHKVGLHDKPFPHIALVLWPVN